MPFLCSRLTRPVRRRCCDASRWPGAARTLSWIGHTLVVSLHSLWLERNASIQRCPVGPRGMPDMRRECRPISGRCS